MERETTRVVGDTQFVFRLEPTTFICAARTDRERWEPLCAVVPVEFLIDQVHLLSRVADKIGFSREGVHGFSFEHDYPDELETGVTLFYFESTLAVSERFFAEFALATVSAYEELARAAGETPDTASYERELNLLRKRLKDGFFEP